ncbi:MAG: type 4a pilus biogenesis protein PilO [Negativicutes bacterium]|nr:type 4a pilus biogenesis protein PilO [Negativicutes bacterium]
MRNITFSTIKTNYAVLLYGLGLIILTGAYVLLVYWPQTARINDLRTQLALQRQQVKTVEDFVLAHPETDKYLAELGQRQGFADKLLPNSPDIGEFVREIQRAAVETGVQISYIKPAVPVNKEGYREIPLEILLRGTFFQTTAFLKKLEDGSRFSSVHNLTLHSRQGMLEGKVNVSVFCYGVAAPHAHPAQSKTNAK